MMSSAGERSGRRRWALGAGLAVLVMLALAGSLLVWQPAPALRAVLRLAGQGAIEFDDLRIGLNTLELTGVRIGDPPDHRVAQLRVRYRPGPLLRGRVEEIAVDPGDVGGAAVPVVPAPATTRVTFTAVDAPLREMIPLLAEAAGVSVVVEPGVEGLVTVHFEDLSAMEAFELVVRGAGYEIREAGTAVRDFQPRTAFFVPLVNVNRASAAEIQARFGTSRELAEWIVLSRVGG